MTITFPQICPTKRTFTPARYATKRFASISGAGTTRLYGSKAFDASLQLQFLLDDSDLDLLLQCWHDSRGDYEVLGLPASVFAGLSAGPRDKIAASLNWRWAEQPQVESVLPGRSRVTVNLVANLDA